jgi:hypothetical protein
MAGVRGRRYGSCWCLRLMLLVSLRAGVDGLEVLGCHGDESVDVAAYGHMILLHC